MKVIFSLVIPLFLLACSNVKPIQPMKNQSKSESITFQFDYGFYVGDIMDVKKVDGQMNPHFIFPTVPGSIFGNPSEDVLYIEKSNPSNKVTLTLPKNVDDKADVLSEKGLTISPADTKILRLASFYVNPEETGFSGGGGFVNTDSNNLVILVYVSKPSKITGVIALGSSEISHNLNFESAGWHWLESIKLQDGKYQLINLQSSIDPLEFGILPPHKEVNE